MPSSWVALATRNLIKICAKNTLKSVENREKQTWLKGEGRTGASKILSWHLENPKIIFVSRVGRGVNTNKFLRKIHK